MFAIAKFPVWFSDIVKIACRYLKYNENTFEKSGNDIILGLYFFFVSINPNKRIGLLTTRFRTKLLVCYVLRFCILAHDRRESCELKTGNVFSI